MKFMHLYLLIHQSSAARAQPGDTGIVQLPIWESQIRASMLYFAVYPYKLLLLSDVQARPGCANRRCSRMNAVLFYGLGLRFSPRYLRSPSAFPTIPCEKECA